VHDIKTMPLADLKEAPYNPRTITPKALLGLTESVKRFGLVQPIVWNKQTGHVVGGHQRIKVLKNLGQKEALVVIVDMPESEEKALNVTMNNPNIAGDFTDGLESVLDDIKLDMPDVDFDGLMLGDIATPIIDLQSEKEINESEIFDSIEKVTCPKCGHVFINNGENNG